MKRKNLAKFRIDLGINSQDMAKKLGISRVHYSNIENGQKDPSFKFVQKFAEVFKDQNENIWELFKQAE